MTTSIYFTDEQREQAYKTDLVSLPSNQDEYLNAQVGNGNGAVVRQRLRSSEIYFYASFSKLGIKFFKNPEKNQKKHKTKAVAK